MVESTLKAARIRVRKDLPIPRGVLGSVVLAHMGVRHPITLRRTSALLRSYTGLRVGRPSVKQVSKARADINRRGTADEVSIGMACTAVRSHRLWLLTDNNHPGGREDIKVLGIDARRLSGTSQYFCGHYKLPRELKNFKNRPNYVGKTSKVVGPYPLLRRHYLVWFVGKFL